MQFSAQEEYGLRCLLRLELGGSGKSATLAWHTFKNAIEGRHEDAHTE